MTLILRANKAMTAPIPGTPVMPDLQSGLIWDFDARTLSLGSLTNWESSVGNVTAQVRGDVSSLQVQDIWGKRCVRLPASPGSRLFVAEPLGQNVTKIVIFRADPETGSNARLLTAETASGAPYRAIRSSDNVWAVFARGADAATYATAPGSGLQVHGASFNASTAIATRDGLASPVYATGVLPDGEISQTIGNSHASVVANSQFVGVIYRVMYFDRAFTGEELQSVVNILAAEWA